jgi:hypothetical protein
MPVASAISARRWPSMSHVDFGSCVVSAPSRTLVVLPHGHCTWM